MRWVLQLRFGRRPGAASLENRFPIVVLRIMWGYLPPPFGILFQLDAGAVAFAMAPAGDVDG